MLHRLNDWTFGEFLDLMKEYTRTVRRRIKREFGRHRFDLCIGTGGNIEELGNLRRRLFDRDSSRVLTLDELEKLDAKLGKMTVEQRMEKLDLRPDRADVIAPAATVLHMIARAARIEEIQIPGVGLKDGLLWDMLAAGAQSDLPRRDQAWTSAMRLGKKYRFDAEHGQRVARTAQSLFDQTLELHDLKEEERMLLGLAALLHDIGHFIGALDHDRHGYYILQNAPLIGLSERQQEMVALIVRSHRKATLKNQERACNCLERKDWKTIGQLCALLRLADAIEVSHTTRIREVKIKQAGRGWELTLRGEGPLLLEHWALAKRKSLFEEVFKTRLEILD